MKQEIINLPMSQFVGTVPAGVFPIKDGCRSWHVLHYEPSDASYVWRNVDGGEGVWVPLLPLCSLGHHTETALAMAFNVGLDIAISLPPGLRVREKKIFIGWPMERLESHMKLDGNAYDCMRFWIGVAAEVG